MRRTLALASCAALLAGAATVPGIATADPPPTPGGPCIQDDQNVSLASVAG